MKSKSCVIGLALIFITVIQQPSLSQTTLLRAGAAVVDISPQTLPAMRNGSFLQAKSDRILDPLHARALVLDDGKETIAIVIVDSCMFPTDLCDKIKQLATQKTGIPANRILISATHTHSAPSAMMCLGCPPDDPYVKFVPARVAQSITDAYSRLEPAKVGWAIINASDLTNCRRWITRSDRIARDPFGQLTVRAMMHPGYQNPNYTSPAGPIDPWLSVLSVVSVKDNRPISILANLSMHYFGGAAFSADYFGEVAQLLEQEIGGKRKQESHSFVGIMSQGTSGDLHWMDYNQPQRGISRNEYSRRVVARIIQALKGIQYRPDVSLGMAERRLEIDRRVPDKGRLEWARPINAARQGRPARNRVEVMAQQAEWIHKNPKTVVVLQAARIGELGITAIPNEVFGITGLKLKRQSPFNATFNLELANGATGYIPPPEQHRLGGYTTWPARTAGLVENAEPIIVKSLLELLEKISERKRRPLQNLSSGYSKAVNKLNPIAYWRMDEMDSTRLVDQVGNHHGSYQGGVALFLPGPEAPGFVLSNRQTKPSNSINVLSFGNRSVYLAGGHVEVDLSRANHNKQLNDFSLNICFWNALPATARETTGVVFSMDGTTLSIAGKKTGADSGKLVLSTSDKNYVGKTPVSVKHWHQLTVTRSNQEFRVYLDGRTKPEITARIEPSQPLRHLLIGRDKKNEQTLDGKVDEISLFDRALNPAEVRDLYVVSGLTPPPRPKPSIMLGPKPTDTESRDRYSKAVMASKPVAFWRLHDQSNDSAKDKLGKHDAIYENGANPLAKDPTKQNFSGGRVRATVSELTNAYSVELWFRNELSTDSRPVTAYVFSRAANGVEGAMGDNVGIGGTHSNSGNLIVFNGNERNQLLAGRTQITKGSWSHVVFTRKNQNIKVYLNGDTQPEIQGKLPIGFPNDCSDILLGGRADQFANLQGMLEEVAIYNRELNPAEINAHFEAAGVKRISKIEQPEPHAEQEPTPTPASKAIETIRVRDGFEVQLVAAEPLVKDPVAIDWGTDGKLWVVEMADYPLGMDGKGQPGGRVRFLEDTNADGQYDQSTLFAKELSFPTGILCWGKGVLVTAAPEILYLEDSSGDGKADVRRTLYSGFLQGNQQLRVNGLRPGLDNWIYCASGSHHAGYGKDSSIKSHLTGKKHQIGSRDFRIRPSSGAIDPQSGPSQFGRTRDDWGNWFGVQNSHPLWHYVLADHYIRRNPHFAPPDPRVQVVTPTNPKVFPTSKPQKRYHNFNQSGRFTSACAPMIYRDETLFKRGGEQHAFTCEPFHNLVQHNLISDNGVSFKFRRDPAEKDFDFFSSHDRWCRPVMARTGPDGAIWIVDMYRYMIEHPQWLPKNGKDELRPWFRSGEDRGRIYRIVRKEKPVRKIPRIDQALSEKLVETLKSPNGWQRDTAQRILVDRFISSKLSETEQQDLLIALENVCRSAKQPLARLHALCTLDGINRLTPEVLEHALADEHAGVRRIAVRIAFHRRVDSKKLASLVTDPDPKVRLELAATLGAYPNPISSQAIARLIVDNGQNRYLLAAAMSSLNPQNVATVTEFATEYSKGLFGPNLNKLVEQAVLLGNEKTLADLVNLIHSLPSATDSVVQFKLLAAVLEGWEAKKISLGSMSNATREQVFSLTNQARHQLQKPNLSATNLISAIQVLCREPAKLDEDLQLLANLLQPKSPPLLQKSVVDFLAKRNNDSIGRILLAGWRSHSPSLRSQILTVLVSRNAWAETLQKEILSGNIRPTEMNASIRQLLLSQRPQNQRWQEVFARQTTTSRTDVLLKYRASIDLAGNTAKGETLFRKHCINCHKLNAEGHEVGPQLASITNKTKEALLIAILDPNAAVDAKYMSYLAATIDGRNHTGRLETETGSSITLLAAEGKRTTLLRRELELLKTTSKSLMPEGLEQELSRQDVADLIQFVREKIK